MIQKTKALLLCIQSMLDQGSGHGKPIANKNALEKVKNIKKLLLEAPENLSYTEEQIENIENDLFHVNLTASKMTENNEAQMANTKCLDFVASELDWNITIAGEIIRAKVIQTKKKETMAFLSIKDETCQLDDIVVFPNVYKDYSSMLWEGNIVFLKGNRSKQNRESLVVNKVEEI